MVFHVRFTFTLFYFIFGEVLLILAYKRRKELVCNHHLSNAVFGNKANVFSSSVCKYVSCQAVTLGDNLRQRNAMQSTQL